ncbi:CB1 cannabinoid receptor-interacting protein 1a isoform X2 [Archocentrus centrarchus]|uniref:CB1 cannabinoid receptor-interacting protein 1a isoform X2 n=1 Tax=Archocentrus centrarchus TaxID=63155 RepID=UPI0011E9E31C|nr:CB1 cannabinoid receptor-interacting protein 1-like isoform X2 [Archocentrus centrarchus]
MDDVPSIINISIALRIQPNEGPVFFKVDGTRFGQSRTIKLLTGSKYKIEVVMKPGNVEATNMNIGGIVFPLEQQSRDEDSVVYYGQYDTEGVPHTKSEFSFSAAFRSSTPNESKMTANNRTEREGHSLPVWVSSFHQPEHEFLLEKLQL